LLLSEVASPRSREGKPASRRRSNTAGSLSNSDTRSCKKNQTQEKHFTLENCQETQVSWIFFKYLFFLSFNCMD